MPILTKNIATLLFILFFVFSYYAWVTIWDYDENIATWGGNILSLAGSLISALWLMGAARRTFGEKRKFWMLLSIGCFNYFIAEIIWLYDEKVLGIEPPSPGWTDFFYIMQCIFYLAAFIYLFKRLKKSYGTVKLIFDILIVMTVAATFSWHYLIGPILADVEVPDLTLLVNLSYPVIDLALLFGAMSLYWGTRGMFPKRLILFIFLGLTAQALVDSVYLYLLSTETYDSGSSIDPFFMLCLMLVGYAGFLQQPEKRSERVQKTKIEEIHVESIDIPRITLPYLNVMVLFIFMISGSAGIDAFTIGTGLSIVLVIVRQLLIILENHQLVLSLYRKTEELEFSEERYKSLFEYHPDAVYSLDMNGNFDSTNTASSKLLDCGREELIGVSHAEFLDSENRSAAERSLALAKSGYPQRNETQIYSRSGRISTVSLTHIPIRVRDRIVGIFGIGRDITENKRNEERIRYLAYHDVLTGLSNRAAFDEQLKAATEMAGLSNETFAVVMIDLDRFKNVNDTLGHDVGDRLLVSVAERLRLCVGESDMVARQGGDEFTLILRSIDGREGARAAGQRILEALSPPHSLGEHEIVSLPSIGLSVYPIDDVTPVGLMKKADIALYQVKYGGRGHYRLYCEADPGLSRKFLLEKDLGQAIEEGQLFLHYQPQIESASAKLTGVEALIRWNHPQLGVIPPTEFIPIAEESGQILTIGDWVLKEACMQAKRWSDEGHPIKIGVNLSPKQLYQPDIVEHVQAALSETGLSPELLDLEITESTALSRQDLVLSRLQGLKALGLTISIDDFGTGYSSLSYLESFPIDKLKIARQFTSKLENRQVNRKIVSHIIDLARTLEINVIAEGVENESQAAILRAIECVEMQGFLFGRPSSAEEIGRLLVPSPQEEALADHPGA
ncbi:putative bifunctional diguanylate cyclase/phosphodiesterase [Saccharibacillus kuerlensis]|uniref:Diguanylate cyclase n=1 Tax=Saccharibacillus kuerlensis TaxID=459527 RepID=A0ABQ2KVW1_9BACL|nr:EAL domain-containing protein [Saccharibacillus kuerlensis]GGN94348.1 diguanylate cyclase [Saccharibacillus kuerlensis]